jgi:uncharacterized protein (TIGR04255 family)
VVIGVQFSRISNVEVVVRNLWDSIRADFPNTSTRPRDDRLIVEDLTPTRVPALIATAATNNPSQRHWLIGKDEETYLIQIQDDVFYFNWRKRAGDYPRFDNLFPRFLQHFSAFAAKAEPENEITKWMQQVEVTYINWITDLSLEESLNAAQATSLSSLKNAKSEIQQWQASYLIEREATRVGRLRVMYTPAVRLVGAPQEGLQFSLTYRSPLPPASDLETVKQHIFEGHDVVVRAFTDLTTAPAHTHWGLL